MYEILERQERDLKQHRFNPKRLATELRYELSEAQRQAFVLYLKRCPTHLRQQAIRGMRTINLSKSQYNASLVLLSTMSVPELVAFFEQRITDDQVRDDLFARCCQSIDVSHQALIALAKRP